MTIECKIKQQGQFTQIGRAFYQPTAQVTPLVREHLADTIWLSVTRLATKIFQGHRTTRMLAIFALLLLLLLLLIGPSATAAVHNLSPFDQGWYNFSGSHSPTNTNTLTGSISGQEYRSWFKFTLPAECSDGVQSASFLLNSVSPSRGSGTLPHNIAIREVSSANIDNLGVSSNSVAIFNDLGDGTVATTDLFSNGNFNLNLPLSNQALTAMQTAAGTGSRSYGLGFQKLGTSGTVYVMGFSSPASVSASLQINCLPNATLTLNKTISNDHGGTANAADFTPSVDSTATSWGTAVSLRAGTYKVSETTLAGYSASEWSGDCAADGSITLSSGQSAICRITNDDQPAKLTLSKTLQNNHGGSAEATDFIPAINGRTTSWGIINELSAGSYTVSESHLAGYQAGSWTGDCNAAGSITLSLGQEARCSVTNRDLGVDLDIRKSASSTTANIGETIHFQLRVFNDGPDTATGISIRDALPAGFSFVTGSMFGGDVRDQSDPTGNGLEWTINSLPADSSVMLGFEARVKPR